MEDGLVYDDVYRVRLVCLLVSWSGVLAGLGYISISTCFIFLLSTLIWELAFRAGIGRFLNDGWLSSCFCI